MGIVISIYFRIIPKNMKFKFNSNQVYHQLEMFSDMDNFDLATFNKEKAKLELKRQEKE